MKNFEETNELINDRNITSNSKDCNVWLEKCLESSEPQAYFYMIALALGNAADAVEILCVGYIMNEIEESTTSQKEFLSAAVFFGMLVGGLFSGVLSDRIGRKPCLMASLIINATAGLASAVAPSITALIICRVIGGLGIGGSIPTVFTLGAEIFSSNHRGKMLSYIASFWMVGAIFTSTVGWIMLGNDLQNNKILPGVGWRLFAAVCVLPALLAIAATHWYIPESPRYLINKARFSDAANVLTSMSGVVVTADAIEDIYTQSNSHISIAYNAPSKIHKVNFISNNIFHLFSKNLWKTTLVFMLIWFTLSFGSYGISSWISVLFDELEINNVYGSTFLFALANLPGNAFSIMYIDVIGRHRLLQYGMCLAALSALGFAFGTASMALVVLCSCLFNAFSVVGWNSLDCMSAEEFPTEVRTTAMGIVAAAGRIGAAVAMFVNGTLESNVAVLLFVTSGCMMVGGLASGYLRNDATKHALSDHV